MIGGPKLASNEKVFSFDETFLYSFAYSDTCFQAVGIIMSAVNMMVAHLDGIVYGFGTCLTRHFPDTKTNKRHILSNRVS